MKFNLEKRHTKGEIKKALRKTFKFFKQKLQTFDQSSSLSPSQGKHMEFSEFANIEKEKIENLKQVVVKQEETIFNLSRQKKQFQPTMDQLNIDLDQLKDLLVKKLYYTRINLIKDLTSIILICKNKIEANQNQLSNFFAPQYQDQQRINKDQDTLINRIKILKKLRKKKRNQQEDMLILSIKLTIKQKLKKNKKIKKQKQAKTLKQIAKIYLTKSDVYKIRFFKKSHKKNKFPYSLPYQKTIENKQEKSGPLQTCLKSWRKSNCFQTFKQILL